MKTTDPKLLSEKRNARWRILVCVLFAALIPELHASPTTVTLRPVADAELQQAQPDSNIGGNITMVSGELGIRVGGVLRRAVLRFDLAGQIPAGAIINSVSLQVRVMRVPIGPANSIFDLRRILQPWSESGVTWNSRLPATPWQVPGVTGAADSVSAASSTVFVSGLGSYTFPSTPALIADVQAWANDPSTNSGWLLISEGEGILKTARHFATHEDAVNGPVLTVIYTQPPPVILTEPLDQTKVEGDTATFAVLADGTPPLNYQWQFNDNDLLDQTNSALTLTGVSTNDAGFYRVIVNNVGGSTSSREALLTVLPLDEVLPRVTISSPASGVKFREHSDVPVTATVTTSNATLSSVEFFTNGTSFAIFSNSPVSFVLSNLAAGQYDLRARATDSATNTGEATVSFRVQTPPRVAITSPTAGLRLPINSNVTVVATTEFPTLAAEITSVDFFENDVQIGNSVVAPPFSVNWIPATLGDRTLTARAVDDLGQIGTNSIRVFVFLRENSLPTVAITNSPPNFSRRTNALVTLAGTARDDVSVLRVDVQVNNGPWLLAAGTTEWSRQVTLAAGPNAVRVRATDQALNPSPTVTRFYTYVVTNALTVFVDPAGSRTVTPDLNGRLLEIGTAHQLTAKPAKDWIFDKWEGEGVSSQGPILNFIMRSNLTLTARFVTNPFTARAGNFAGLVWNTNSLTAESSGLLTLSVTKSGTFTGNLILSGRRVAVRGKFDPLTGLARTAIARPRQSPVALDLHLDVTDSTDTITGSATDGLWTSDITARRNVFNAKTNPAPQAGVKSISLQPLNGSPVIAVSAVANVSPSGSAALRGRLVGDRPFHFGTSLDRGGAAPFYVAPRMNEAILGWLNFGTNALTQVDGNIYWIRPP